MDLVSGDVVAGRYRIVRPLGAGGMGAVYLAVQEPLGREVALKVVRPDRAHDTGAVERFKREAKLVSEIVHPNVVTLFDFGVADDGSWFLVMEHLRGESLRDRILRGALPWRDTVPIVSDICAGLAAAHRRGVVHRDLKPENIIVGDEGHAKVLDFGIAKRSEHAEMTASQTITDDGHVVGTPGYMAPELALGAKDIDPRADLYSLGVVWFELLTGRQPFDATSRLGLAMMHAGETPPAPSQRAPSAGIPVVVDELVLTLLKKSPEARPTSAAVLGTRLAALITAQPSPSPPLNAIEAVDTVVGRKRPGPDTDVTPRSPDDAAPAVAMPHVDTRTPATTTWRVRSRRAVIAAGAIAVVIIASIAAALAWSPTRARAAERVVVDCMRSPRADVDAEMKNARRAARDGDIGESEDAIDRAVSLDPSFAPALLRRALALQQEDPERAADDTRLVLAARDRLCPRDDALLLAADPFLRPESRVDEFEKRLERVHADYPRDVEISTWLATAQQLLRRDADAVATLRAAVAVDPHFMEARWQLAQSLERTDPAAALVVLDECLALSPGATSCLWEKIEVESDQGRCNDVEDDARTLIARRPSAASGYRYRAGAMLLRDERQSAVSAILADAAQKTTSPANGATAVRSASLEARAHVAIFAGDFVLAESWLRSWQEQAQKDASAELALFRPARDLAFLLVEEGRMSEADAVADAFLDAEPGLVSDPILGDRKLEMLSVKRVAGTVTAAEFGGERDEWLAQRARMAPDPVGDWYEAYGVALAMTASVDVAADAARALATSNAAEQEPPVLAALGRAKLLAGDARAALPWLDRAARNCDVVANPFVRMHALLDLGAARAALGDDDGARTAYREIVRRWGTAKASRTLDAARTALARIDARAP